jgi:DNA-binding MarR family transcriptional regulator
MPHEGTIHHEPTAGPSPTEEISEVDETLLTLLTRLIRDAGLLRSGQSEPGDATHPVSLSEGFVLMEILEAPAPLSQRNLVEGLNLDKSTVSRLVSGLERRGMVRRARNRTNQRFYDLSLTEYGKVMAQFFSDSHRRRHMQLLRGMNEDERRALSIGLGAFLRVLAHHPPLDG